MGIGLVILHQAAQEELGTQDLKAQEESEGFNEVEPMGGEIEVTQRFIDLLNGRVSAMDWFGPHWLTRRPQMTLADFGMTLSEMPRETDAQKRLISLRHRDSTGLTDTELRLWVALEWNALGAEYTLGSHESLRNALERRSHGRASRNTMPYTPISSAIRGRWTIASRLL